MLDRGDDRREKRRWNIKEKILTYKVDFQFD